MAESTVTVTVTYSTLETPTDMVDALEQSLSRGYFGTITALKDDTEEKWALVLNTPANTSPVTCRLGDVLMWDGAQLQAFDAATFAARYASS